MRDKKSIKKREKQIAARLKQARLDAGLKQTEFAALLAKATGAKISQPMVTQYENAALRLHSLLIFHCCEILEISADWLLGLEE